MLNIRQLPPPIAEVNSSRIISKTQKPCSFGVCHWEQGIFCEIGFFIYFNMRAVVDNLQGLHRNDVIPAFL